jgi:hypothetical protein
LARDHPILPEDISVQSIYLLDPTDVLPKQFPRRL